jgi:glycosyltransferase involved in cell wall biosynthesis
MPKVSVIITCYNLGRYVDEAVDSVLDQTFNDFEIIIVNDGSTDQATLHLLSQYQRPQTIVYHTNNKGLPAARNYGIERSNGDYITCLDADDKFHADFLKRSAQVLDESELNIGFVPIGVQRFGASESVFIPTDESFFHIFADNIFVCACMFRKKCWEFVGGYDESMRTGYEDWDFWLRCIENGYRWKIIPEVLFYYRDRKNSMISKSTVQRVNLLRTMHNHHLEYISEHLLEILSAYDEIIIKSHENNRHWEQQYQEMDARLHLLREQNGSLVEKYLVLWWDFHIGTNASTVAVLGSIKHAKWLFQFLTRHGFSMPAYVIDEPNSTPINGVYAVSLEHIDWNRINTIVLSTDGPEAVIDKCRKVTIPVSVRILRPFADFPSISWPVNLENDALFASGLVSIYNSFAYLSQESMACYFKGQPDGSIGRISTQAMTVLRARAVLEPLVSQWENEGCNKRVMIFGAGSHSKVILGVVPSLFKFLVGFIDSKRRDGFIGLRCHQPSEVNPQKLDVIVYSSAEHEMEMYQSVAHLQVKHVLLYHS